MKQKQTIFQSCAFQNIISSQKWKDNNIAFSVLMAKLFGLEFLFQIYNSSFRMGKKSIHGFKSDLFLGLVQVRYLTHYHFSNTINGFIVRYTLLTKQITKHQVKRGFNHSICTRV